MEVVSKPFQDQFLHPILVHSIIEKKENTGSQMGQTKKIIFLSNTVKSALSDIMKYVINFTTPLFFEQSQCTRVELR